MKKLTLLIVFGFAASHLSAQQDEIGSGHAIQFDAIEDYIDLGNIYDNLHLPITISAWVYVEPSSQYILPIIVSQDNAPLYNGFWFCLSGTNLFFEYGDGRGEQHPAFRKGKSASIAEFENRWLHVSAVVKSGSDIQLFVNGYDVGGAYTGLSDQPMSSNYPNDVAKIGYLFTNDVLHRFKGVIDELRIWNRAVTQNEIRETMCKRLKGDEPGLIGYWTFDETGGDILYDQSPMGYDGELKGNPKRVFSGAPVGDESVFLYATDWTGKSLSKDDLSVTKVEGNPHGVHIYRVNHIPSQTGGLDASNTQWPYYGVFLADDDEVGAFDLAFSENMACEFFQRRDNSEPDWDPAEVFSGIQERVEIVHTYLGEQLEINLGADVALCNNTSLFLEADPEPTGKTFLWSTGENSPGITVTSSGKFSVEVRQGCLVDRDTVQVSFLTAPPDFSLGEDEAVCSVTSRILTIDIENKGFDFTWHDGSKETTLVADHFGDYWLKLQNACGYSIDSISLTQKLEDLDVYLGPDVIFCDESSSPLRTDPALAGKSFLWNTGETTPSITVSSTGEFSVEVGGQCGVGRDTIKVSFLSSPPAFSLGEDEVLCILESRTLGIDAENAGFNFTWSDGSGETRLVVHHFGTYWLKLENACGPSVDSITFTQKVMTDLQSYNFISPDNKDDFNQFFELDERLLGAHLLIFNRWGKRVFESFSYKNDWDGSGLPAGVYYYTVRSACIEPLKGSLTIMR